MSQTINVGWLKDKKGEKFAPKTLMSQVATNDGIQLDDKIEADFLSMKQESDAYIDEKLKDIAVPTSLSELNDDAEHRTVTDEEKNTWNQKSNFSGKYEDLEGAPSIPSKVSELENDEKYLTIETDPTVPPWAKEATKPTYTASEVGADAQGSASSALESAKAYTDEKIDALVGEGASTTLDTIGEISQAFEEHKEVTEALKAAIGTKANARDLSSHTGDSIVHITSTERTNWDDANSKKHSHSNKTILDNTTASFTTEEKIKLSGIEAGANAYIHPTTSGNKHIPAGGSSGQILRWSADGTAVWGDDNDTTYSTFVKSGSEAKAGLVPAPSTTAGTTKYLREDGTWQVPPTSSGTDTKNTAGASNTSSKIYLVGATSQGTNPQTYTHDTAYVGTDGCLYSNSQKTLTTSTGMAKSNPQGTGTLSINGTASGGYSAAIGYNNQALGTASVALGYNNIATGSYSYVEGIGNNEIGTVTTMQTYDLYNSPYVEGLNSGCSYVIDGVSYTCSVIFSSDYAFSTYVRDAIQSGNSGVIGAIPYYDCSGTIQWREGTFSAFCGTYVYFYCNTLGDIYQGMYIQQCRINTGVAVDTTASHIQGKYSKIDKSYAHVVGNGSSSSIRSNAHTLDWNGNAWYAGDVIATRDNFQEVSLIKNVPYIIAQGDFSSPSTTNFNLYYYKQAKNVTSGLNVMCGVGSNYCATNVGTYTNAMLFLFRVVGYEYSNCQYKPFSIDVLLSTSAGTAVCGTINSMYSQVSTPLGGSVTLYLSNLAYDCGTITGSPKLNVKTSSSNIHICEIALMP